VSIDAARAELGVIAARSAASNPETHRHLRLRVTTYAEPLAEGSQGTLIRNVLYVVNGIFLMLLAIVCTNVATLVFARTATRGWEMAVRSALGASRGRILSGLFIEALVLAGVAALVGLLVAKLSMRWGLGMLAGSDALPYWIDSSLSWNTVLYTGLLTLIGAAIIGMLPALRVTRVSVQDALRSEGATRTGLRFGGFWTSVIVVQIAITVALLPLAAGGVFESNRFRQGRRASARRDTSRRVWTWTVRTMTWTPSRLPRAPAVASVSWSDGSARSPVSSRSPSPTGCP
jgi:putative ABC transport system permease protein